jgi:hypothetical protein
MEPIESGADGPAVQELQLCPHCYLVIWHDGSGFQIRQGVPVREGVPMTDAVPRENGGR